MAEFDPTAVLEVLVRHQVRFVVIGGFAAAVNGAPYTTFDIDITPDADPANLDRLSAALAELEARIRTEEDPQGVPFAHTGRSLGAAGLWNLTTRYGDLDIAVRPAGTTGYADLRRDAVTLVLHGVTVAVASLADVVRSKEAAGRPKDRAALPLLRETLAMLEERRRD